MAQASAGWVSAAATAAAAARVERPRKRTFKENHELAGMEAAILTAEAEVTALETTLSDPAVFKDRPLEVPRLNAELEAARREVERLYARWAELDAIPAS